MSAKGFAIAVGLLFAGVTAITPAWADVYKCTVGGQTVYQDKPCAGKTDQKPMQITVPTPATATASDSRPVGNQPPPSPAGLASLYQEVREAEAHSRQLQADYEADVRATRARAANMPVAQQNREADALKAKWQPRFLEADQRTKELTEQLRRECPGGANLNDASQSCR